MSLKAIIATLVLGSSSVALASPAFGPTAGPTVRDHRTQIAPVPAATVVAQADIRADIRWGRPRIRPMPVTYAPVTLADNLQLEGRAFIKLAPTTRQFSKLELRTEQGRTSLDKVVIVFGNGRAQTINLDAKLSRKNPTLAIDLQGETRSIERIVLVGKSNGRNASLDVIAI